MFPLLYMYMCMCTFHPSFERLDSYLIARCFVAPKSKSSPVDIVYSKMLFCVWEVGCYFPMVPTPMHTGVTLAYTIHTVL